MPTSCRGLGGCRAIKGENRGYSMDRQEVQGSWRATASLQPDCRIPGARMTPGIPARTGVLLNPDSAGRSASRPL